jgi:hypothetical protein
MLALLGGYRRSRWEHVGPFDNDTAADWCGELDDAATDRRARLVRDALAAVVDNGDDYVNRDLAVEAVAAAAVVASQLPDGYPISSAYAPGFLRDGGTLDISGELRQLAVLALDRVVGDTSGPVKWSV